jgi:hypothetical protein
MIDRAERFPLEFRVKYRPVGTEPWIEGVTKNISRSGVLFSTEHVFDIDTPIEIDIALRSGPAAGSDLVCHGRIVRTEQRIKLPAEVAIVFSDYQFIPLP